MNHLVTKFVAGAFVIATGIFSFTPSASADFKKTKIAVLDFQTQGEETTKDMGNIVSEWMITGLVETGRFDVIERRLLEKIMEEHKLGMTGILDTSSVAELGKVLGVKTVVAGTILGFEGTLEINARLISVESGAIISAEKVSASSATRLNDLVSQITERIVLAFPLEGYIVQRTDKKVTIDLGRLIGVKPGMKFVAFKEGKVIRHPKTGEVLDVETVEIGEIEITDVREKTANGIVLQETSSKAVDYGVTVRSSVKGQLVSIEEESPRERKKTEKQSYTGNETKGRPKVHVPAPSF